MIISLGMIGRSEDFSKQIVMPGYCWTNQGEKKKKERRWWNEKETCGFRQGSGRRDAVSGSEVF